MGPAAPNSMRDAMRAKPGKSTGFSRAEENLPHMVTARLEVVPSRFNA